MKAKTDTYSGLTDRLICAIFLVSLVRCSRRTSDNQGLEGAARAGLEERGQMSSRQEVKVEHKVSVAAFTSRDEKWVGEGREEDTTEERREWERERRLRLKVTGKGDERHQRDTRPNNADELKATVKETWASIPPQQCHKLITSMPR